MAEPSRTLDYYHGIQKEKNTKKVISGPVTEFHRGSVKTFKEVFLDYIICFIS